MALTVVSCTSAPLTRRSAKLVGLGGVFIISTFGDQFTITRNGNVAQKGVMNHEVVSVAPPAAQANVLDEDVDSPGPGPQPVSGKPTGL